MLTGLGVRIGAPVENIEKCLREINIGFMTAQAHHPAMALVAPTRKELGVRTLFNLLGPLSNPAGVKRALIGVADARWMDHIAQTLNRLGAEKVWIAHGSDGLDEITTTGPTEIIELDFGRTRRFWITPEEAGCRAPRSPTCAAAIPRITPPRCAPCSAARKTPIAT